jgi:hypothetical protein
MAERAASAAIPYLLCPGCDSVISAAAYPCPQCKRCPSCGSKAKTGAEVCLSCGFPSDEDAVERILAQHGIDKPLVDAARRCEADLRRLNRVRRRAWTGFTILCGAAPIFFANGMRNIMIGASCLAAIGIAIEVLFLLLDWRIRRRIRLGVSSRRP